jgi:hypothetical protein
MLHWQSGASGVEYIHRCLGTIYLKNKSEQIYGLIHRLSMRLLQLRPPSVPYGTVRMSVTHVNQVDAVSTLALELRIRTIRKSPDKNHLVLG